MEEWEEVHRPDYDHGGPGSGQQPRAQRKPAGLTARPPARVREGRRAGKAACGPAGRWHCRARGGACRRPVRAETEDVGRRSLRSRVCVRVGGGGVITEGGERTVWPGPAWTETQERPVQTASCSPHAPPRLPTSPP